MSPQQPLQRGIIEHQAARGRALPQDIGTPVVVQHAQCDQAALREARTQVRQCQRQRRRHVARGVHQRDAGIAHAVVQVEQRDFVVASAGDGMEIVQRDQPGMLESLQCIPRLPACARQRQVTGAAARGFGSRAGGEQQMGLAAAIATLQVQGIAAFPANERLQLRQRKRRAKPGFETLVGRIAQRQWQLRTEAILLRHAQAAGGASSAGGAGGAAASPTKPSSAIAGCSPAYRRLCV